jgi:2-hydroxy-6-oxonona-2,4-dienedioate hydrolase
MMKINRQIPVWSGVRAPLRPRRRIVFMDFLLLFLLFLFGATRARAEFTTNGEVAGLRAQFADINGIRTRYYEMGEGDAMVLVHGEGWSGRYSANIWSKNIPLFAKRFHVLAPDKVGSGMTGNPQDDNGLNIQGEVDHLYDFIRAMKLGTVHLVGQSRGGACVFFLALQHPEVVRDLVIVDSNTAAPEAASTNENAATTANCPKEPEWEAWKCRVLAMSYSPDEAFDDEYFMAAKYMSLLPKSQETVAKLKAGAGGELATAQGFNQWKTEWYARIKKEGVLQMPVLIYWGLNDPAAPAANGRALYDLIAAQNTHVKLITAEKAGHFPFREYPERFVSDVTNFTDHPDDAQMSANPSN